MASGKEIKQQISSIKSTQKITSAMQLVASSKMRHVQLNRLASQPYARKIREVSYHLAAANLNYQHPFLIPRPVKRAGFIVISSDRGLCGGLNINLFKAVSQQVKTLTEQNIETAFCAFGSKAVSFFNHFGGQLLAVKTGLGDEPNIGSLLPNIKIMLDAFNKGELDQLYLAGNRYINTMTQKPYVRQLLPLIKNDSASVLQQGSWIYLYEPDDPKIILDQLLIRYVESQVYQAVVENIACEQAARMIAMKSATDNADQLIEGLQLAFNKARQAAITQEISEIVSGAAAV